jgi:pilus assembly protein CpaE
MHTLVIHTENDPVLGKLKGYLQSVARKTEVVLSSDEAGMRESVQRGANLVIVSLASEVIRIDDLLHKIRGFTEARILIIGPVADPKLILRTLQAGADLFIDRDEFETELPPALHRLFPRLEAGGWKGRVLGVLSASGGCGASTMAVNLAALFAQSSGQSGLIDLNPGRGDLPALLDLKPQFTLIDVCMNEARLDRAMLEKMLFRHDSGIQLLASPPELSEFRSLSSSGIRQAILLCRTIFRETVIDLEDCIHSEQIEALQLLDQLFIVCRLDFTSLRNTRRSLEHIERMGIPRSSIKLVVNQHGTPNELPVEEAEQAIGEPLTSFIPYDPKCINAANNLGVPAVLKDPNSKLAQSLLKLIAPDSSTSLPRVGLLGRIKLLLGSSGTKAATL